jgi:hypothetical protein
MQQSRPNDKRSKFIESEAMDPIFDLSHCPMKENQAEFPMWVGDLRKKYYKKGADARRTDQFEYVSDH